MLKRRLAVFLGICVLGLSSGCAQNRFRYKSAQQYFEAGKEALSRRKCWEAQQTFRNLLSDFPGSHLVDDAQYMLGQSYYCSKDYVTAIFEYQRLLNEYPTSPFLDEARYQIGMCYYKESRDIHHDQDETRKAILEFNRFIEDFPNSDLVPETKKRIHELRTKLAAQKLMIAENYLKWGNPLSTMQYCQLILKQYPDTDVVWRTRFLLAEAKFRVGELKDALNILTVLSTDSTPKDLREKVVSETAKVRKALAEGKPARVAVPFLKEGKESSRTDSR